MEKVYKRNKWQRFITSSMAMLFAIFPKKSHISKKYQNICLMNKKDQQSPPDLEEIWKDFNRRLSVFKLKKKGGNSPFKKPSSKAVEPKKLFIFAICVCILAYLGSGALFLNEGQSAVVMRLGKYQRTIEHDGLYWHLPYPFASHIIINTAQDYSMRIGDDEDVGQPDLRQSSMLTKDAGIIELSFNVRYRIINVRDYLFNSNNTQQEIKTIAQSVVRQLIAQKNTEEVLLANQSELEQTLAQHIQSALEKNQSGVRVTGISIDSLRLPAQLSLSFASMNTLKQEREQQIKEAQQKVMSWVPQAQTQAQQMIADAHIYAKQTVVDAEGDVARFNALYPEYKKSPDAVKHQLYTTTMKEVYSKANKIFVGNGARVNIQLPEPSASASPLAQRPQATAPSIVNTQTVFDPRSRESLRHRLGENNEQ